MVGGGRGEEGIRLHFPQPLQPQKGVEHCWVGTIMGFADQLHNQLSDSEERRWNIPNEISKSIQF